MASIADRLSLFPDDILIDILSRLSIRDAIATGILSKRWRYLWTHITSLNIIDPVYRLETHNLPRLFNVHKLTLDYTSFRIYPDVTTLVQRILRWNFRVVKIFNIMPLFPTSEHYTTLFDRIVRIPSLTELELVYDSPVRRESIDSSTFPNHMNLRLLKLVFLFDDDDHPLLVNKLIKCCPLLEDLSLSVRRQSSSLPWHAWPQHGIQLIPPVVPEQVILDAPNIKYLKLNSFHLSRFFFTNNSASALQEVGLRGGFGTVIEQSIMSKNIFEVMSKARSLSLGSPTMLASQVHLMCLPNLVHLKCTVCCSMDDITHLLDLLSKCPKLEVLILNFTDPLSGSRSKCSSEKKYLSKNKHSKLFQFDIAPTSLVILKKVVIKFDLPLLDRGAFFVVKHLLGSASVLERLIINVTAKKKGLTTATQCHELQICRDIFALPRKSVLCQVELYGVSLKSSDFYSN